MIYLVYVTVGNNRINYQINMFDQQAFPDMFIFQRIEKDTYVRVREAKRRDHQEDSTGKQTSKDSDQRRPGAVVPQTDQSMWLVNECSVCQ